MEARFEGELIRITVYSHYVFCPRIEKRKEKQVENPILVSQEKAQSHKGGEISLPVQGDLGCPLK